MFKLFRFAKLFRLTKLSRATKLFRLTRLIGLSGKLYKVFSKFLNTNGLIYALYFTIAMITGTIATYFLSNRQNISDNKPITNIIKTCSDLTDNEKEEMIKFADYLISKRKAS